MFVRIEFTVQTVNFVKIYQFSTFMDIMMRLIFAMQIHTLCIGAAAGHACLVLAAGKKGKRYMFPHAKGSNVLTSVPVCLLGNTCFCSLFPTNSGSYYVSYDSATTYSFLWDDASIRCCYSCKGGTSHGFFF